MKTNKIYSIISLLMSVMTLTIPFTALAQDNPIVSQAQVDAIVIQQARADAARADAVEDANKDVNKPFWFGAGCLFSGLVFVPLPGLYTACLLPPAMVAGTYFYKPEPSPARFIGKPAEYIETYTSTYKSKRGGLQVSMSAAGCLTGCGATAITLIVWGFTMLEDIEALE